MKIAHFASCSPCGQEYYNCPSGRTACPSCGASMTVYRQEWLDDDAISIDELLHRAGYRSPFEPVIVDMGRDWGVCSVARNDLFQLCRGNGRDPQTVMVRTHRSPAFGRVLPAGSTVLPTSNNRSLVRGGPAVCADTAHALLDEMRAGRRA